MSRAEDIRRILLWEQAAAECRDQAFRVRGRLAEQARAEFAEQGTAPTWRVPEIGTVSLPVTQECVCVLDEAAVLPYVKTRWPEQIEERVRISAMTALLGRVSIEDGRVIDDEGTVVPGLGVSPGGRPLALTIRPARDARTVARGAAVQVVADVAARLGLGEP